MAVFPIHSTDDYWAKAVELFTGYPVPPREGVFDHLIGNDGIPLMDVSFSDLPSTPDTSIYKVVDKLFWREANSNGIVYVQIYVPFYVPANGSRDRKVAPGTKLKLRQAKIELLGTSSLDDGTPLRGAYEGGEFGDNWSNRALHQYAYGGGRALEALNWGRTTARFSWGGLHVPIADAVDYNSFDRAADAFTRAAIFFDNQRHVLERWQSQLGKEDSAWRGQAAGVFADLIGKLNKLYHDYGEDMPRVGVASSRHAERLRRAREQFVNATNALHDEWLRWVDWLGNPLQHLHNVLLDVTKNIWDHNISQVDLKLWEQGVSGGSNSGPSQIEKTEEIAETAAANFDVGMNKYGHYEDMGAWKKIGEDALASWQDSVVENLGKAAKTALMSVRDAFSISLEPISARSGTRLSDDLQKDLLEKEKEDQKHEQEKRDKEIKAHEDDLNNKNLQMMHEQEENAKHLQEEQAKREKEREEAEKHLRDEQAKREKERDEAEKHLREEQERKQNERDAYEKHVREEQEKAQKEENHKREVQENHLRHEQEKKQNERDAYEKHVREEQEQKQKAQEERQEQQRQEQEKIRKEETHKQDARLADQERAQALVRSQEKADRDQERKRQEQVRKEQEARQEQLEQRQEQKREEQEKKQEQARIKTEAAYEERRKQEEARQAKLSGDQQHRQEQLEQRQEQQRKQEEARQAKLSGDQQHRQEQLEQRQEQQRK
ncbi:AAWKG family protein, partial [Streptomyces sp. NPDC001177]